MATIGMSYVVLEDKWPGPINPNLGIPTGGWDNTTDCCVTVATYPVGTKIMAYNDCTRNPGYYTMGYMGRADGSFITDHTAAVGDIAGPSVGSLLCTYTDETTAGGNTYAPWYHVSGDCTGSCATSGMAAAAFACGSMGSNHIVDNTNDGVEFGWFWIGGVCPGTANADDLTWLHDCSMTAGGAIASGLQLYLVDDGTNGIEFNGILDGTYETQSCGWATRPEA